MRKESGLAIVMNFIVSGYVYFVAFMLVLFMMSSLVAGLVSVSTDLLDLASSSKGLFQSAERTALELRLLHTIAFTIVLVKAYKILISYAQTRAINLKFLVEISIIAPTIELLFNSGKYDFEVNILLAAFGFSNLLAYLIFYKTLKEVSNDYLQECKVPEVVAVKAKQQVKPKKAKS